MIRYIVRRNFNYINIDINQSGTHKNKSRNLINHTKHTSTHSHCMGASFSVDGPDWILAVL